MNENSFQRGKKCIPYISERPPCMTTDVTSNACQHNKDQDLKKKNVFETLKIQLLTFFYNSFSEKLCYRQPSNKNTVNLN